MTSERQKFARRILITASFALVGLGVVTTPASASTPGGDFYQPPTSYANEYAFDPGCPGLHLWVAGSNHWVEWILNVAGSNHQACRHRRRTELEHLAG